AFGAEAPIDVVVRLWPYHRPVALVAVAEAPPARGFAAAVVVADDVGAVVGRVLAGADPGDRRHFGSRGATARTATAATAQDTVDRAVTPIVALRLVARILRIARRLGRYPIAAAGVTMPLRLRARYRQHRDRCCAGQRAAD